MVIDIIVKFFIYEVCCFVVLFFFKVYNSEAIQLILEPESNLDLLSFSLLSHMHYLQVMPR